MIMTLRCQDRSPLRKRSSRREKPPRVIVSIVDAVQLAQVIGAPEVICAARAAGSDLEDADGTWSVPLPHGEAALRSIPYPQPQLSRIWLNAILHPLIDDFVERRAEHDERFRQAYRKASGMRATADGDARSVALHQHHTVGQDDQAIRRQAGRKLVSWPWPLDTVPMTTSTSAFRLAPPGFQRALAAHRLRIPRSWRRQCHDICHAALPAQAGRNPFQSPSDSTRSMTL